MQTYHVKWEIELEANDYRDAAEKAQRIHRNMPGVAEAFEVADRLTGATITVDLARPLAHRAWWWQMRRRPKVANQTFDLVEDVIPTSHSSWGEPQDDLARGPIRSS